MRWALGSPTEMHPGQSLLPGRLWGQRWCPQVWGAQGLRWGLGNNQKWGDGADDRVCIQTEGCWGGRYLWGGLWHGHLL